MRHVVIAVSLLFLIAGGTGWWLFGNPTLQVRAFRAYQAGRYSEALPLLKQWAATPKIRNDRESLKVALAYISGTEQKLKAVQGSARRHLGQCWATPGGYYCQPAPPSPCRPGPGRCGSKRDGKCRALAIRPKAADRIIHQPPAPGETAEAMSNVKELGNFEFNPGSRYRRSSRCEGGWKGPRCEGCARIHALHRYHKPRR